MRLSYPDKKVSLESHIENKLDVLKITLHSYMNILLARWFILLGSNIFLFRWSFHIPYSKILLHYIISKMFINPAKDFQSHLMQAGVCDQERIIQVSQCTIHHTEPKNVKTFLSYYFPCGEMQWCPKFWLSTCSRRQQGWEPLINWYLLSFK